MCKLAAFVTREISSGALASHSYPTGKPPETHIKSAMETAATRSFGSDRVAAVV